MGDTLEVCPNADWRDAAIIKDPVEAEDFDPSNDDWDEKKYIVGVVEKNVVNLALLGATLVFLLSFILWRLFRCMCILCCCKDSCDERRQRNATVLWSTKAIALTTLMTLVAVTICGLGGYGLYNLDVNVTKAGWAVIGDVRDVMDGILDFATDMVGEIGEVASVLVVLENIFQEDVNMTDIGLQIDCVETLLQNLPRPTSLQSSLDALDVALTTTLPGDILTYKNSLSVLETNTFDAMATPVATISASESIVSDLGTKMTAYDSALDALPGSFGPGADAAVANLQTAHNDLSNLNTLITSMTDLRDGVQDFAADVQTTPIDDVGTSITGITNRLSDLVGDLNDISADLLSFASVHGDGTTCMNNLLTRMVTINETLLRLPEAVDGAIDSLEASSSSMTTFFATSDPTVEDLADELDALSDDLILPDASPFISALSTVKTNIQTITAESTSFITDLNSLIGDLGTVSGLMGALGTALSGYSSPGNAGTYLAVTVAASALVPSVQSSMDLLADIEADYTASFTLAGSLEAALPGLRTSLQAQETALAAMEGSLAGTTDLGAYANDLDEAAGAFDGLGANPVDILTEPGDMLDDLDEVLGDSVTSVLETTEKAQTDLQEQVDDVKEDVLGDIDEFVEDNREKTIDINESVHMGTMALYLVSFVLGVALVIFTVLHCQFGVGLTLCTLLLILVLYHLIATALGAFLIVMNDGCHHVERIAISEAGTDTKPLLEYYLFDRGGPLRKLLKDTGTVDLDEALDQAMSAKDDVVDVIRDEFQLKGKLDEAILNLSGIADNLVGRVDELETLIGYEELNPLYVSIKSYFCCTLTDVMHNIWKDLTVTGGLGLLLAFMGFLSLQFLDMMPRVDCCGCTCRKKPSIDTYDKMTGGDPAATKALTEQVFASETSKSGIDTSIV